MQELGVNVIRVFYVNAGIDHDGCMSAFEDAGIYVLITLDSNYKFYINEVGQNTFELNIH